MLPIPKSLYDASSSLFICLTPGAFNALRPRQNGRHFPDDISKCIFLNENVWISINISLKFVLRGPINHIPTSVQVMAWRRPGDKPLSEPMMVRLPTHICVTRPQWVKLYTYVELFSTNSVLYKYKAHPVFNSFTVCVSQNVLNLFQNVIYIRQPTKSYQHPTNIFISIYFEFTLPTKSKEQTIYRILSRVSRQAYKCLSVITPSNWYLSLVRIKRRRRC